MAGTLRFAEEVLVQLKRRTWRRIRTCLTDGESNSSYLGPSARSCKLVRERVVKYHSEEASWAALVARNIAAVHPAASSPRHSSPSTLDENADVRAYGSGADSSQRRHR
jgi:hypothetical protein